MFCARRRRKFLKVKFFYTENAQTHNTQCKSCSSFGEAFVSLEQLLEQLADLQTVRLRTGPVLVLLCRACFLVLNFRLHTAARGDG